MTLYHIHALITCTSHAHHMLITCTSHAHHMLITCTSHAHHMHITSHAHHMHITCTSHAHHMLIMCKMIHTVLSISTTMGMRSASITICTWLTLPAVTFERAHTASRTMFSFWCRRRSFSGGRKPASTTAYMVVMGNSEIHDRSVFASHFNSLGFGNQILLQHFPRSAKQGAVD